MSRARRSGAWGSGAGVSGAGVSGAGVSRAARPGQAEWCREFRARGSRASVTCLKNVASATKLAQEAFGLALQSIWPQRQLASKTWPPQQILAKKKHWAWPYNNFGLNGHWPQKRGLSNKIGLTNIWPGLRQHVASMATGFKNVA